MNRDSLTFSFGSHPNCHLIGDALLICPSPGSSYHSHTFEFLSYIRHLFVNALLLQVPNTGSANIRDELAEFISRQGTWQACHRTWVRPRMLVAILR